MMYIQLEDKQKQKGNLSEELLEQVEKFKKLLAERESDAVSSGQGV